MLAVLYEVDLKQTADPGCGFDTRPRRASHAGHVQGMRDPPQVPRSHLWGPLGGGRGDWGSVWHQNGHGRRRGPYWHRRHGVRAGPGCRRRVQREYSGDMRLAPRLQVRVPLLLLSEEDGRAE